MTLKKLITTIIVTLLLLNSISWAHLVSVSAQDTAPPPGSPTTTASAANCKKIGINSAAFYNQGDAYYTKASSFNMGWSLEIANANNKGGAVNGINQALANGLTPVLRIGVGNSSYGFLDPANYVAFLNSVADQTTGGFYAVAGPNEPDSEHWLAQERGDDYDIGQPNDPNTNAINKAGRYLADYMNAVVGAQLNSKVKLLSPTINISSWSGEPIIQAMIDAGANFGGLDGFSATSYSFGNSTSNDISVQVGKVTRLVPGISIVLNEFQDTTQNLTLLAQNVAQIKSGQIPVLGALLFNAFNTNTGWSQYSLTDTELVQVLGAECANLAELNKVVRPVRTSVPCQNTTSPEFNPLRPYPGNPCDPLIPRSDPRADREAPKPNQSWETQLAQDYEMRNSVAFSCGNSLTPTVLHQYDKGSRNIPQGCTLSGRTVRCINRENFTLTLDLTDANLPILGNTQNEGLTDAQKMTEYLSWYLNGAVQHSEQDANPSTNRLVNYSGPLQKLLPQQLKEFIKDELLTGPAGQAFIPTNSGGQYHNYIVEDPSRLKDVSGASLWEQIFRNVPFSSLEDTTGEVVISVSDIEAHGQQDKDVIDAITPTTPLKLTIRKNSAP